MTSAFLCSHPYHLGQCPYSLCGCTRYRPDTRTPGDEAERWLAGREAPVTGESATRGTGAGAA
jgi:hypothetical protein